MGEMANTNLHTTITVVLKINVADYISWQMFTISKIYFLKDDMTLDNEMVTSFD